MPAWTGRRRRPAVSVAMATFQGETYLARQLQTLADQTFVPAELVVRDDGSTDRTVEIVRDFATRAPFPVTVLPGGERLGNAQNFVAAARECTGDLLFFADQDDERPAGDRVRSAHQPRRGPGRGRCRPIARSVDHRLHDEQAWAWVPDDSSRRFTRAGTKVGDV